MNDKEDNLLSEVINFENEEFGTIRTVTVDGEPWFVGRDVAKALGYKNANDALSKHVDEEDKDIAKCDTPGGEQDLLIINEAGLYSLAISSKLPTAKQFKRWITHDVVPSIRKRGLYATAKGKADLLLDPDFVMDLARSYKQSFDERKVLAENNALLRGEIRKWEPRDAVSAMIRKYASAKHKYFGAAFNEFYRELNYSYHISVGIRAGKSKVKKKMLSFIRDDEMPIAIKVAAAMCESAGLNPSEIVNEINMDSIQSSSSPAELEVAANG